MPVALERKLKRRAKALKRKGVKVDEGAYVYGTMRKTGWKPSTQKKVGRGHWPKQLESAGGSYTRCAKF